MAVACLVAAACYHWAELTTTFGAPNGRAVPLDHVVTVFASSNVELRRAMESRLARGFTNAAPSFRVLVATDATDSLAVRRVLHQGVFDSAIIMSVVQTDGHASWAPGAPIRASPAPTFDEQWTRVWHPAFDPATTPPKRTVAIEIHVYSLIDYRLVWAGRGDDGDAKAIAKLGESAMANLTRELEREGLLIADERVGAPSAGAHAAQ